LHQGAPVIASSHRSIDGLAHLCVLDDIEHGLTLYRRRPIERLKAVVRAQGFLADRLDPERIADEWRGLLDAAGRRGRSSPRAPAKARDRPVLLVLIDIHQDTDVLLPILMALKARGLVRLRIVVTDWLVDESPRALAQLEANGLAYELVEREAVRRGEAPALEGAAGALGAADASVRAHQAGHTLIGRARAAGLPTFTIQHGLENIGLTYKDELHTDQVRFAAETIFTWQGPERLAPWAAAQTRAAVVAVGSPKAAPPPARAPLLNQGFRRVVGVFENLHWQRFDDAFRARFLADLEAAAAADEESLFLVKPHHAGRWLVRNRARLPEADNLFVIDPLDPAWEPHTAPALIAGMDVVLTTPSTVALDAARAGRPVAVIGYGLDLPLYEPLPILRTSEDWDDVLADDGDAWIERNEAFLKRALLPGRADHRIAARIEAALLAHAEGRPRRLLIGA
jgi:hypothetical protein